MIEVVIFDMDGVLLDSEPFHEMARQKMYQKYGISCFKDMPKPVGKSTELFWEEMKQRCSLKKSGPDLEKEQYEIVLSGLIQNQVPLSRGLEEVMVWLKHQGIKVGLASSSTRFLVEGILCWKKLETYFDEVVTGDEVRNRKPSPEIYETIGKRLNGKPENTLAIEDSFTGVLAAKRAGVRCVGYKNLTSGQQDLSMADIRIEALIELKTVIEKGIFV